MYHVYFLYSGKKKNVYIGHTSNLEKRVSEHNHGRVKSTRSRRPLILIRNEIYSNRYDALRREEYLKSLYGTRERKRIVEECLRKNEQEILMEPYTKTSYLEVFVGPDKISFRNFV